jgi:hypothetical protein
MSQFDTADSMVWDVVPAFTCSRRSNLIIYFGRILANNRDSLIPPRWDSTSHCRSRNGAGGEVGKFRNKHFHAILDQVISENKVSNRQIVTSCHKLPSKPRVPKKPRE